MRSSDLVGGDEEWQRDIGSPRDRWFVVHKLGFPRLDVDDHAPERRCDPRNHQRAMIVETNLLAIKPASFGAFPPLTRDRIREEERVACSGRVDRAVDRHGIDTRGDLTRDDQRTLRSEREHDLGDAERAERFLVDAAAELDGLLVVQLERRDVTEDPPVERAVADQRADSTVTNESLGIDDESVATRRQSGERLEREVAAGEGPDDDPRSVVDLGPDPALDIGRRPGIPERVDAHDPRLPS